MQEEAQIKDRFISASDLKGLRSKLPSSYYKEFAEAWNKINGKKNQPPSRQKVILLLKGKTEDDAALEVILGMIKKREELKRELNSLLQSA